MQGSAFAPASPLATRKIPDNILNLLAGPVLAGETSQVRIAQQFGINYLSLMVVQDQKLLETKLREAGLPAPAVTWAQFSGGQAMNDALLTGALDFASAGVAPAVTLWARTRGGLDVHAVASLGSLPGLLVTNNPAVHSLKDFTDKDRIAVPAVKVGVQSVMLEMAADKAFGQFDRLDALTVSLPHPDAVAALLSSRSDVDAHFSTSPFQEQELADPRVHAVLSTVDILGGRHTANVIYGTGPFERANPKTVKALVDALAAADEWIGTHPAEAAALYIRFEHSRTATAEIEKILADPDVKFTVVPERIMPFLDFQYRIGQIKVKASSWQDLFFPEIHDRSGS